MRRPAIVGALFLSTGAPAFEKRGGSSAIEIDEVDLLIPSAH
jgi:hypothetical protein